MIAGIGCDIVDCTRIRAAAEKHGQAFLDHLLTPREQAESRGAISYYAGRWAAKEALSKALGCGIGAGCAFTDIEILDNAAGCPEAVLTGAAKETADRRGAARIHVSISHERDYAVGMAVLETAS